MHDVLYLISLMGYVSGLEQSQKAHIYTQTLIFSLLDTLTLTGVPKLISSSSSYTKPLLVPAPPIALYSFSLALAAYTCRRAHARTAARGWPGSPACVKGGNQHQASRRRGTCIMLLSILLSRRAGRIRQTGERKKESYRSGVEMMCKRKGESKGGKRGPFPYFKNDPEKSLLEAELWRLDTSPLVGVMSNTL